MANDGHSLGSLRVRLLAQSLKGNSHFCMPIGVVCFILLQNLKHFVWFHLSHCVICDKLDEFVGWISIASWDSHEVGTFFAPNFINTFQICPCLLKPTISTIRMLLCFLYIYMASPLFKRPSPSTGAGDPPLSLRFEAADPDYLNRLNVDLAVLGHDLVDAGDLRRWEKNQSQQAIFLMAVHGSWIFTE